MWYEVWFLDNDDNAFDYLGSYNTLEKAMNACSDKSILNENEKFQIREIKEIMKIEE